MTRRSNGRHILMSFASLTIAASLGSGTAKAQSTVMHALTYAGWWNDGSGGGGNSTSVTNAQIDAMYVWANAAVLQDNDAGGTDDVACGHVLTRSGDNVGLHGNGSDGDVSNGPEFDYINAGAVFLKIVPTISWCGILAAGIAGCTATGRGNSMLLAEWGLSGVLGGINAAHEFGHATGLTHTTTPNNLMGGVATPANTFVTSSQCTSLKSNHIDADGPGGRPAPVIISAGPIVDSRMDFTGVPVERVAHSTFVDSAPAEVADYYGSSDLVKLRAMLADPSERPYHVTIAMLIGLISAGSDADAVALTNYVAANGGTAAGHAALMSLGDVAARGNKAALATLLQKAEEGAPAAVGGLGLSGHPEALKKLHSIRGRARSVLATDVASTGAPGVAFATSALWGGIEAETVEEAIRAHQAIASRGRRAYYGR